MNLWKNIVNQNKRIQRKNTFSMIEEIENNARQVMRDLGLLLHKLNTNSESSHSTDSIKRSILKIASALKDLSSIRSRVRRG